MKQGMPAKIKHPGISGIVKRTRLFQMMDARTASPVVWLSSSAGSGKTKLVASYLDTRGLPSIWYQCDEGDSDPGTFFYYMALAARNAVPRRRMILPLLTPEYLQSVPAFARRFFELLYTLLLPGPREKSTKRNFFIVLDDYQDVPGENSFHDMLAQTFEAVPAGIRIVVISRNDPPVAFARLKANGRLSLLKDKDLRFTPEESQELVRSRIPDLDEAHVKSVHKMTEGWATGLVLLLEQARLEGFEALAGGDAVTSGLFDYFAGELFRKTENEVRQFLMKTAFLPSLTALGAARLTGDEHADIILEGLARHNFFTERLAGDGPNYRYHPLFRDHLAGQARAFFRASELSDLRINAAKIQEEGGNIEDAARLYSEAGRADQLARLVIEHAGSFIQQGRNRTVAEWLAFIPQKMAAGNPWLLYWTGLSVFPADMIRMRHCMEEALEAFRAGGIPAGIYLAWAGIVDSYAYNFGEWDDLDKCIETFNDLQRAYPIPPSDEIDMTVSSRILILLILRQIEKSRPIQYWFARISRLMQKNAFADIHLTATFYMSTYYLWKGEYNKNALLLEKMAERPREKSSPLGIIGIKLMTGIHYWVTAQYDAAVKALNEGLAVAEESGVHHYDSLLWSFLAAIDIAGGNRAQAEKHLKKQKEAAFRTSNTLDMFFCHINAAWQALTDGDGHRAAMHMETIAAPAAQMGHHYYHALWLIGMAQVLYLQGRPGEAQETVSQACQVGRGMKSTVIEWYGLLVASWFHFCEGDEKMGLKALRSAMALGRKHGYVNLEFYQPAMMRLLCAKALEQGIEEDYVRSLIRKLRLAPPVAGMAGGHAAVPALYRWPYPVRIHTLGRFDVFEDQEPLTGTGKVQKKPLEMLKAIIAAGGAEVSAVRLADELWPNADGDLARTSFDVTLSRLRHLFANDVIIYKAGRLSLNPGCCWVDSLALAGIVAQAAKEPPHRIGQFCDAALDLYQGHFLPDDTALPWVVHYRETLKNGLLQIVMKGGRHSENTGAWEAAIDYYEAGLNIDPLTEEFYQRLMVCNGKLGKTTAAVRTFQRCSQILCSHLGIKPSGETVAILSSLAEPSM